MLNKEQQVASDAIKLFLSKPFKYDDYFVLSGPPGSGKTYMLDETLSNTAEFSGGTIAHSAKNVLKDSFAREIECFTVAQLLGLSMKIVEDTFTFTKSSNTAPKMRRIKTLILDEISMIDDYLFGEIMLLVNKYRIKLIAVGDRFQLPPVGQEHDSKFFDRIDAELIHSMRFAGEIGKVSVNMRTVIDNIDQNKDFDQFLLDDLFLDGAIHMTDNTGFRFENDIMKMVEMVAKEIDAHPENLHHARILAYFRSSVSALNEGVREFIYGKNAEQFEFNEIVICDGGYSRNFLPILYNGQILRVTSITDDIGEAGIPCKFLRFASTKSANIAVPVVADTVAAKEQYDKVLAYKYKMGAEYGQWKQYRDFINSFAKFDYAYATTLHKAQGMTLNKVYVLEGEIMSIKRLSWKQKFQALYVAMTRAKTELVIYNKNRK